MLRHQTPRLSDTAAFSIVLGLSVLVAMIPVALPALDLDAAGLFIGPQALIEARTWGWVIWVNESVPTLARWFSLLAGVASVGLFVLGRKRARLTGWALRALFLSAAMLLGPGLAVMGVKHTWDRARPTQVEAFGGQRQFTPALHFADQCETNCAFVSGHVSSGFFFASLMLWGGRRRWWVLAGGTALGLTIGFCRMADGAHWLSDVLWAFPVTMGSCGLVWWLLTRWPGQSRALTRPLDQGP